MYVFCEMKARKQLQQSIFLIVFPVLPKFYEKINKRPGRLFELLRYVGNDLTIVAGSANMLSSKRILIFRSKFSKLR